MVYVLVVALANNPFTLHHPSGFVALSPFLFDCGCAIVVGIFL
jgi:hypothetical protein